jgi:HlyD family secretion protein
MNVMTKPNRKRLGWSVAAILGMTPVIAAIAVASIPGVQTEGHVIPTARVAEGDVPVVVHATGELRPLRAQALVAPSVGGPMQIVFIATTGTPVKAGDLIVEFDQSEQQDRLETAKSELAQAEQEIAKMRADAVVQRAQDDVTLLTARFDVRRAELDVEGSVLHSAIDKQKFLLTLEEAKGRLAQLQDDLKSRAATDRASLAVLEEKRNKARLQMDNAQRNIDNMKLRAPFDGLVAVKDNDMNNAAWAGVVVPEFRAGDTVFPGRQIAEVLHESGIELIAKVNEYDRAHLNAGQKADVTIHAVQGKNLPATIKAVAGASRREVWSWNDPTRTFDVSFDVTGSHPASLRPGLTTQVRVTGAPIKGAQYLPRQALFEQDGKPVVFVRQGRSFEPREVKVSHWTETHIVVTNLPVGTEVALRNPLADEKKRTGSGGPVQPRAGA